MSFLTVRHQETRELVKSAFSLARALGIKTLVVQADEISDRGLVEQVRDDERVIWVVRERKQMPIADPAKDIVLAMPDATLNRLSQLNLALFLTALNRHLAPEEKVLGLSGVTGIAAPGYACYCEAGAGLPVAAASHERDGGDTASCQVAGDRLTLGP
jgi:hypothetical protein